MTGQRGAVLAFSLDINPPIFRLLQSLPAAIPACDSEPIGSSKPHPVNLRDVSTSEVSVHPSAIVVQLSSCARLLSFLAEY
jgi:hypothetical protein